MNRFASLLLLLTLHFLSYAQNVTIKGSAKTYEYKEIGVWVNSDYISNAQKQLTYSTIDSAGNFLLEFNSKEIQYITLKIEKNITSMYIEPNRKYEVIMLPPDSTTYQNPNLEHDVKLSINLKSKTEINSLTMDYDKRFENFMLAEIVSLYSRRAFPKIDSFRLAMHDYYSTVKNNYFDNYISYSIATLKEKIKESPQKLFENFIDKKPIGYNNPEYMNFFNAFYKQKLENFALSKEGNSVNFQINNRGSFSGTMDVLQRDPFLKNDSICELVLLKGLYEGYYDGSFNRPGIIGILQQITTESKIDEHKRIAQNILNSFSKLQPGSAAPFFELPDKAGLTHSLDELRDKKYIYLTFYDATCSSCLEQMKVIPSLKKRYGERITFVSISTDKTNADLKNFCTKNPKYDWLFLYDSSGQLKNNYEIKSLPAYFLINPDGKFVQVPAESPAEEIDRTLYDIVKPKAKLHGIGDKQNH